MWYEGFLGLSPWSLVAVTLLMTHVTIVGVTVYLHRYSAHRSLELNADLKHFFRFWLWLTTGMALIYTRRESDVSYPESGGKVSQHDWDYAPRLGLRYDIRPDLQVYGNLSRSVEPPHPWSLIWSAPVSATPSSPALSRAVTPPCRPKSTTGARPRRCAAASVIRTLRRSAARTPA